MGEWSGCDDDTVAQGVDVVYRYTNHCNICHRLAAVLNLNFDYPHLREGCMRTTDGVRKGVTEFL